MEKIEIENEYRGPIKDLECEKMVIASIISSYNSMADCESILDEECFYDLHHQEIYRAVRTVYNSGSSISIVSINAELAKMGSMVEPIELTKILYETPIDLYPQTLSLRLRDLSYRRKLWEIGMKLISESGIETFPLEMIHNSAKEGIDSLFENLTCDVITLSDAYREVQEQMLINQDREPGKIIGSRTGFPWIDNNGGFTGPDLIIIGAETSQGKTSFATSVILNAIKTGEKIAFYSMEMTPKQLASRIASMQSGINSKQILNGSLELNDIYRIDAGMEAFDMNNLFFDGRSTASLDSIMSSIRQLKKKYDIKGACVDYLQLVNVSVPKKVLTREQEVAKVARDLKNLAKELNIWIIAISQLSRGDRGNPIPTMAMLRDSGQIEQAADMIILLYRPQNGRSFPSPYENIPTVGRCLVNIAKGRNIGTGEFICGFRPQNTLFFPLSPLELENMGSSEGNGRSSINTPSYDGLPPEELPF
ncbi:MAG: DNA helicase [Muribaculaceae bacterium]|nr:DNA helicase [Muribaculaceae bacterium]